MSAVLEPWAIRAVNLPEHADNPVHTVEGGIAAGYDGAVVAGTTIYAYLTRPAAAAWGAEWVGGGSATVRFLAPVLAAEAIDLVPEPRRDHWAVHARRGDTTCATLLVGRQATPPEEPDGERLEPLVAELADGWAGYAARAGEDLELYGREDLVHPVVWPSLANRVFATQLVEGAWVHTRSDIRHLGTARPRDAVVVESWLTDRFTTRTGERAVVDVRISVDDRPVAAIEHEAIVKLA